MNEIDPLPLDFERMRAAMVDSQLRTNAVDDPQVIAAMASVPREQFVPEDARAAAYADRPLPLGEGRSLTLPMATGRMLTRARVRSGEKVLLIGAASGYVAAVLAYMGAQVIAVEDAPGLLASAQRNLAGDDRVTVVEGPLAAGWQAEAPYALIVIDGAVAQLPPALSAQLAEGGRMVCGMLDDGVTRLGFGREGGGEVRLTAFADADIAPLAAFTPRPAFVF